ncbi:MAG TPA: hypothetical protein VNM67_01585 [Thermoanaerobaculia bacterium]|jgi:hypothetical protein|nr:hypothetical protein [Thermoanaerobaculia bacterium]
MTRDEYEARKRRLEEDLRSGMELLQAAFQTQFRALEMVWMGASGEPISTPQGAGAVPPEPPEAQRPARRRLQEICDDISTALPTLPEVFDRGDICRAIGYQPDRVALYRLLTDLVRDGGLRIESRGEGRKATKYRRGSCPRIAVNKEGG